RRRSRSTDALLRDHARPAIQDDSHEEVSMRNLWRLGAAVLLLIVTIVLASSPVRAQVITATLYGVVHDGTGAILPGVTVVVTHQGTNLVRETVSDERGEFALPALPAGPYAIKRSEERRVGKECRRRWAQDR